MHYLENTTGHLEIHTPSKAYITATWRKQHHSAGDDQLLTTCALWSLKIIGCYNQLLQVTFMVLICNCTEPLLLLIMAGYKQLKALLATMGCRVILSCMNLFEEHFRF
jgi:hypothetical protein